jgi:transketolase
MFFQESMQRLSSAAWTSPTVRRGSEIRVSWISSNCFCFAAWAAGVPQPVAALLPGFLPVAELATFLKPLSRLNGHPNRTKVPGVEANTGPLGHGLPIAVGHAISAKLDVSRRRTYVLTGDGELQEGSNWEAMMAASQYELDSLTVIVDRNRLQQGATTRETNDLDPLDQKAAAFGFAVVEVNGHDHGELLDVLSSSPFRPGKPTFVIAHTHKGHPISFMSNNVAWHHKVPSVAQLEQVLDELAHVTPRA